MFDNFNKALLFFCMTCNKCEWKYNKIGLLAHKRLYVSFQSFDKVNEWLFIVKWVIIQLYRGENKLHLMRWQRSLLYTRPKRLVGIVIVLADSPRVDMSLLSDTLSWFRAIQSLLLFRHDSCGRVKSKTIKLIFWCLAASHACLRGEGKDCLPRNLDNVPEWNSISTRIRVFLSVSFVDK
jgi:hypothetical protein